MSRWHDRPVEQLFQELESRPSGLTERSFSPRPRRACCAVSWSR